MSNYEHPEFLVSTEWLEANLGDSSLRILDCTTNITLTDGLPPDVWPARAAYEQGHIPGAVYVNVRSDLSDRTQSLTLMAPSEKEFSEAAGKLGISDDMRVIVYSTGEPWWATRVWWLFRLFGFDNVAVLDGGWQKWSGEGRPSEAGPSVLPPGKTFTARCRNEMVADRHEVLKAIETDAACVISGRLPSHFSGVDGNSYGRPGRIAGSINVPAARLYDPAQNTLLPRAALAEQFADVNDAERAVIAYCGFGIAASADVFALTMLGHKDAALYDGSLEEWAADKSLPMAVG